MARRLTEIEKRVYANQTLQLEQSRAVAAARVVSLARQELLSMSGGPNANAKRVLKNLDRALAGFDKRLVDSLKLEGLIESGYRQGRELLFEVSEGDTLAVVPMLDLNTLSVPVSNAVNKISGIGEQLKGRIKESIEVSLALGEGEQQTMTRLMGQGVPGQMRTSAPFRATKIQAERISRTVSNELVNEGKRVSYAHFADANPHLETWLEWVVVSDFRTSDICKALVGQKVKSGEAFNGGGFSGTAPPAHVNCRSTIIPVLVKAARTTQQTAPTLQPVVAPIPVAPSRPVAGLSVQPKMTKGRFPLPLYPSKGLSIERQDARGADYGRPDEETIRVNGLGGVPEDVSNSRLFEARRVAKVASIKPADADTFDMMTAIQQARPVTLDFKGDYGAQVNSDLSRIYAASSHKQRLAWSKEFTSNPNNFKGEASRAIAEDLTRISKAVEDANNRKGEAKARRARAAQTGEAVAEAPPVDVKSQLSELLALRGQELFDLANRDGIGESVPDSYQGVDRGEYSIGIRLLNAARALESDEPLGTAQDVTDLYSYARSASAGEVKDSLESALPLLKTTPEQDKAVYDWFRFSLDDGDRTPYIVEAANRHLTSRGQPLYTDDVPARTLEIPQENSPLVELDADPSLADLDKQISSVYKLDRELELKEFYKRVAAADTEEASDRIFEEIEEFEQRNPYEGGADFAEEVERLGSIRDAVISDYTSGRYADYNRPTDPTKQNLLTRVLETKEKFEGPSYRFSDVVEGDVSVGGVITSGNSFWSSSKERDSRYIKNQRPGYVLEIEGKTGVDVSKFSRFSDEGEVLFSPHTSFEVLSVEETGRKTLVKVRELKLDPQTLELRRLEEVKKAKEAEKVYKLTPREQELKDRLINDLKVRHKGNDKELARLRRWEAAFDKAAANQSKYKGQARLTKAPVPFLTSKVDGHTVRATVDGGKGYPHDMSFTVDGHYVPRSDDPQTAKKIASEAQKLLDKLVDSLPEGSILSNSPVGGPLGTRAMIYSRKGFGPSAENFTQFALKIDGKLVPIIDDLTDPSNGVMPNGIPTSFTDVPDLLDTSTLEDFLDSTTLDSLEDTDTLDAFIDDF